MSQIPLLFGLSGLLVAALPFPFGVFSPSARYWWPLSPSSSLRFAYSSKQTNQAVLIRAFHFIKQNTGTMGEADFTASVGLGFYPTFIMRTHVYLLQSQGALNISLSKERPMVLFK